MQMPRLQATTTATLAKQTNKNFYSPIICYNNVSNFAILFNLVFYFLILISCIVFYFFFLKRIGIKIGSHKKEVKMRKKNVM